MKTLITPLVALLCAACTSQGGNETSSKDSTRIDSTSIAQTVSAEEEPAEAKENYLDEDVSLLDAQYDSCKEAVESLEEIYRVDITTNQYEASSSVTWYFDTNFKPLYFSMEWSAEGNEGS